MTFHIFILLISIIGFALCSRKGSKSISEDLIDRTQKELEDTSSLRSYYATISFLDNDEKMTCKADFLTKNSQIVNNINSYSDLSYLVNICNKCKCSKSIVSNIRKVIENDNNNIFTNKSITKIQLDKLERGSKVDVVQDVVNTIKVISKEKSISKLNEVKALLLLLRGNKDVKSSINEEINTAITDLHNQNVENGFTDLEFFSLVSEIETKSNLKPRHIKAMLGSLSNELKSSNLGDALNAWNLYQHYASSKFQPYDVQVTTKNDKKDIVLEMNAINVLGEDVDSDHVKIEVLSISNTDTNGNNIYKGSLKFPSSTLSSGRYEIEMNMNIQGRTKAVPAIAYFNIPSTIANAKDMIKDVKIGLIKSSSQINKSDLEVVKKQMSFSGSVPHVEDGQHKLHIQYTSASSSADFLICLTNTDSNHDIVICSPVSSGETKYKTTIALAENAKLFQYTSGTYLVEIVGTSAHYSGSFKIGILDIGFGTPSFKIEPLYTKALLDESDRTTEPLPEIQHAMRPPPKRASLVLSLGFTAIPVIMFLVFVGFYLKSFSSISKQMKFGKMSVGFLTCIFGCIGLISSFWLGFSSFYETDRKSVV